MNKAGYVYIMAGNKWKRAWKLREIEGPNPDWNDLSETIAWN